jgi:hypothetical protein
MFDAMSMYTKIDTDHAIEKIAAFLRNHKLAKEGLPADAIISGLELIMHYNVFKFGDIVWWQLTGTAMGAPNLCLCHPLFCHTQT